jgi:hypothetical protein
MVPVWMLDGEPALEAAAERLGFGSASQLRPGAPVAPSRSRLPVLVLCRAHVEAERLLAAAGDGAPYFVVAADTAADVRAAGRSLVGPLRMPEFPDWVFGQR